MKSKIEPGRLLTYISAPLALISIVVALYIRSLYGEYPAEQRPHQVIAYVIVGLWVLCPPIWFWIEWVLFTEGNDERLKHTHDLARNIWIGLVVVLIAILDIGWPNA